ncbi:MAG: hypothetical protein FJY11_01845 [Bacteroidetes bacterium]|nr:hypothetical protein [Bacteroidota bacterium]
MKKVKLIAVLILLLPLQGCDEPETIVTNIVHPDGSVTRRIEMRTSKREFDPEEYRVPVDSTWKLTYSTEVSDEGDTTRVLVAEKLFPDAESISAEYAGGIGINAASVRSAYFSKSFRWFTTSYRFTEQVRRIMPHGYPIRNFLSNEEVEFLMLPNSVATDLKEGADSTFYTALSDSVDSHVELWLVRGLVNSWSQLAGKMLKDSGADEKFVEEFYGYEEKFTAYLEPFGSDIDSVLIAILGEETVNRYGSIFSAAEDSIDKSMELFWQFCGYTVKTIMPGTLKDCNGYISASGEVAWQVRPELFFFEDYTLWAESHRENRWAWYVSGGFVLIVVAGIVLRKLRGR